ncbi:hypothetical protein [Pedobacter nyackensis]|uniref:Uncharacterized protein n=1 Tax=Pedobacter nyackensis TaxID=475255 RepID=A0A1W2AJQ5_9SPHI|nr:hypothetical protein [Pedobacter nyackensis]SMC60800.1 hypothetical protein SAMN04488101_101667 [Pedobacter nyackensis]
MLYFKKVYFQNDQEKQQVENAFRKSASKRNHALDFLSSVSDIGPDKVFLGFERKKDITFTRIRTSFEKLLPKLIISFPKDPSINHYKFRFGLSTTIALLFFAIMFIGGIIALITANPGSKEIAVTFIICIGYPLLTLIELHFVNSRIARAIEKYGN